LSEIEQFAAELQLFKDLKFLGGRPLWILWYMDFNQCPAFADQ